MAKERYQSPRGTHDTLPQDLRYWQFLRRVLEEEAESLGFQRIEVPAFEDRHLFERATGEDTDIVAKEMFGVTRASKKAEVEKEDKAVELVLRPEFTPGIIRAFLENGLQGWPQPVKLFTEGLVWRYSRPQKGRFREFRQANFEIIGDPTPKADVAIIFLIWNIFRRLNLIKGITYDINSLGDAKCRPQMRKALLDFLSRNLTRLGPEDIERVQRNPFRVLDSKDPKTLAVVRRGPPLLDFLCPDCKTHFSAILETLDELNIPYNLDPFLVRGLDYYTRTIFEVRRIDDETRQNALGGGGRYDRLVELLGGRPTAGMGAALGLDRIIDYMKEQTTRVPEESLADVFVVALGGQASKIVLPLVNKLKEQAIKTGTALDRNGLKEQLDLANRLNAKLIVIIGEREVRDQTAILKDMEEGSQETVAFADIEDALAKKLQRQ